MTSTTVVNVYREQYDVRIMRENSGCHYGNPFSHLSSTHAQVIVATREEAIECFRQWLAGEAWGHIEPGRRQWIIETLPQLKGKRLGCCCKPKACHGDVLADFADMT